MTNHYIEALYIRSIRQQMNRMTTGIILWMHPVNERWRYNVTSSLIGLVHSQNDPWTSYFKHVHLRSELYMKNHQWVMRQATGINGLKQIIFHFHLPQLRPHYQDQTTPSWGPHSFNQNTLPWSSQGSQSRGAYYMMGACSEGTFTTGEHIVVKVFQFHGDMDGLEQNCGNTIRNGVIVVLH